jgi:signal transduction histidine kinase
MHLSRALVLLPALLLPACFGSSGRDPESTLHAYAAALEEGRTADAYRLLSDEARRGMSYEAFKKIIETSPEDAKEVARALSRPTTPALITATVTAPTGEALELVWDKGRWTVEAAAIDLYRDDTPRHAIEGYARALERKRYDVILRYAPDAHRENLDVAKLKTAWEGPDKDEVEQVLVNLKQALPTASIEETGDHAQMAYGSGIMKLVKEHGRWRIEDFD